jgi:hypothetical protein
MFPVQPQHYTHAFVDTDHYTSDQSMKKAIDKVLSELKTDPPQFLAILPDGTSKSFDKYDDAIAFLSINPHCKVFVK